jgi:hypothetical protein
MHGRLARAAVIVSEIERETERETGRETGTETETEKGEDVPARVPEAEAKKVKLLSVHLETTVEALTDHRDAIVGHLVVTIAELLVVTIAVLREDETIAVARLAEATDLAPAHLREDIEIVTQVLLGDVTEIEQAEIEAGVHQALIAGFREVLLPRLRLWRERTVKRNDLVNAVAVVSGRGIETAIVIVIVTATVCGTEIVLDAGRKGLG